MNTDIKARLAAGETVDSLMKEMQNQVVAAARELEKEKQKDTKLDIARTNFIDSAIHYLDTIGILPAEIITKDDKEALVEILKECEDELVVYVPVVKAMIDAEKAKAENKEKKEFNKGAEDIILENFLKCL